MMRLPDFLELYKNEADKLVTQGAVHDIEFSGSTYQIKVIDPISHKEEWPFIQLDILGNIKDSFCSCEKEEDQEGCVHLAAAYLQIYNGHEHPLHQRFERSLWNNLFQIFSERLGNQSNQLKKISKGEYARLSVSGKEIFRIKGNSPEAISHLEEIIDYRPKQTEETSLKFSNLSQDELTLWRQGRPSLQLQYELSFWSDFAHWLMRLQEDRTPYQISFKYAENEIPNQLTVEFPEISANFYLSIANLPLIIPALATVDSPLEIHVEAAAGVKEIRYDPERGVMSVEAFKSQERQKPPVQKGVVIGNWRYVHGDGFYNKSQHEMLEQPALTGDEIAKALNDQLSFIRQHLKGTKIFSDPLTLSYELSFDANWNLHVTAYLFSPGDLVDEHSRQFKNWVYVNNKGFYRIVEPSFNQIETVIPAEKMGDFIWERRHLLNTYEGFETHLTSIEAQLTYTLDETNRLRFVSYFDHEANKGERKDFGSWIYVVGQGFYSKTTQATNLPLQPDLSIGPEQIPLFIRMNKSELQLVHHFFSDRCPVLDTSLSIKFEKSDEITVRPVYRLLEEYEGKEIRYFEDFVYVIGEGFSELPMRLRLPENYRRPVTISKKVLIPFLKEDLEKLKPLASYVDPRLLEPKMLRLGAKKISTTTTGGYSLNLCFETERGEILLEKIVKGIRKKKSHLFLKEGYLDLQRPEFDWIKHLSKTQVDVDTNTVFQTPMELIRLNALEEIHFQNKEAEAPVKELTEFKVPFQPDLKGLSSELREYQQHGVHWLWFLYQHKLSGLLCDDMGLGKTHQTMGLLTAIANEFAKRGDNEKCHFLVICPTSVIYHWQEKLAEYLPNLRVCTFYGSNRSLDQFHQEYDILLTSYGIWRLESEMLSQMTFEVAVFDEIQVAKNHMSRIHASLLNVKAKMRLGLTGTPIENRLRELKSLFDIVLPAYMPREGVFRDYFVKPIEREGDLQKKILLKKLINPFVLRRKKEEVLRDLPEKTEEIAHCELSADQELLYKETLTKSREYILQQLQDSDTPVPYLHIFALLSNLKQICNHPAVYYKTPQDFRRYQSGKWDLFVELLEEARNSQQKVVVFSQYLTMLDIFEEYLGELKVGFAEIRGATTDRGAQIHKFNHNPECEVFLGSLQAAGLGVDLTAGSVVIHYDRWWNAAREDQATDRVHRIGQTRGVQVFKLVTKGTFEERIDALISKKAMLLEEVVSTDDHRFMKQFSRDELIQLLQDIPV